MPAHIHMPMRIRIRIRIHVHKHIRTYETCKKVLVVSIYCQLFMQNGLRTELRVMKELADLESAAEFFKIRLKVTDRETTGNM